MVNYPSKILKFNFWCCRSHVLLLYSPQLIMVLQLKMQQTSILFQSLPLMRTFRVRRQVAVDCCIYITISQTSKSLCDSICILLNLLKPASIICCLPSSCVSCCNFNFQLFKLFLALRFSFIFISATINKLLSTNIILSWYNITFPPSMTSSSSSAANFPPTLASFRDLTPEGGWLLSVWHALLAREWYVRSWRSHTLSIRRGRRRTEKNGVKWDYIDNVVEGCRDDFRDFPFRHCCSKIMSLRNQRKILIVKT